MSCGDDEEVDSSHNNEDIDENVLKSAINDDSSAAHIELTFKP